MEFDAFDVRQETYKEATKSYTHEASAKVLFCSDPKEAVEHFGLKPQTTISVNDYPAGTFFYYHDGNTYVREP